MTKQLLFALCAFIFLSCKTKETEKKETAEYTATTPLKIDTSFNKEYIAQLQSVKNIEVRAQEKGYLLKIYVDEGQMVKQGQVLFQINPKLLQAEVLKEKAEVKEAEIELMNAKMLANKDIVAKSEVQMKQAKVDEQKAELALAELHLSLTTIRAPFDGIIDRIRFKLGSLIDEGGLLTTLSDNKSIFAYFNLPEYEYLNYKQKVQNTSSEHDKVGLILANGEQHKYSGLIETIEGEFDNETGNIAFRAKFPNPEMLLKHGETGKVQMKVDLNNALLIPQKATYELQDKIYVFVVDKNNIAKSRQITIKQRLPDIFVIDSGLEEGDKILVEGLQSVKEDEKISCKFIQPREIINNLQLIKQ